MKNGALKEDIIYFIFLTQQVHRAHQTKGKYLHYPQPTGPFSPSKTVVFTSFAALSQISEEWTQMFLYFVSFKS